MNTVAEQTARQMVGDGKTPNRYWVVIGNGWSTETEPHSFDGAEGPKPQASQTFGPFERYEEAKHKADDLTNELVSPEADPNGWHTVTIEDRLNGQCYEATYYEQKTFCACGRSTTTGFTLEWHEETWAGKDA